MHQKHMMAYKGHAANIKEIMQIKKKTRKHKRNSSIGDGGSGAFLQIAPKPSHPLYYVFVEWSIEWFLYFVLTLENYMIQKMENYMIPQIKVRLNLHINSTLMSHQMVFTFCAHILNSYIAWHSRKIVVA